MAHALRMRVLAFSMDPAHPDRRPTWAHLELRSIASASVRVSAITGLTMVSKLLEENEFGDEDATPEKIAQNRARARATWVFADPVPETAYRIGTGLVRELCNATVARMIDIGAVAHIPLRYTQRLLRGTQPAPRPPLVPAGGRSRALLPTADTRKYTLELVHAGAPPLALCVQAAQSTLWSSAITHAALLVVDMVLLHVEFVGRLYCILTGRAYVRGRAEGPERASPLWQRMVIPHTKLAGATTPHELLNLYSRAIARRVTIGAASFALGGVGAGVGTAIRPGTGTKVGELLCAYGFL